MPQSSLLNPNSSIILPQSKFQIPNFKFQIPNSLIFETPMNEAANIPAPVRPLPIKHVYVAMAAYLPAAVAIALPAEKLTVGNTSYTIWLWYQYSGQAVLGVLAFMLLLQLIVWQRKKHWMIWPGILAGLHATAFAALRILSLLQQKAPSGSLAETIHSSNSPMIGLYVLLRGGVGLLGVHGWVWRKK
jgi:hypothetical protein